MKRTNDRLQLMFCHPTASMPANDRVIKVRVSDGENIEILSYGRHTPIKTIMNNVPCLFMDRAYDKRRKGRAKAV